MLQAPGGGGLFDSNDIDMEREDGSPMARGRAPQEGSSTSSARFELASRQASMQLATSNLGLNHSSPRSDPALAARPVPRQSGRMRPASSGRGTASAGAGAEEQGGGDSGSDDLDLTLDRSKQRLRSLDDDEPSEQTLAAMSPDERRKAKRRAANRRSARRVRKVQLDQIELLQRQVAALKLRNAELSQRFVEEQAAFAAKDAAAAVTVRRLTQELHLLRHLLRDGAPLPAPGDYPLDLLDVDFPVVTLPQPQGSSHSAPPLGGGRTPPHQTRHGSSSMSPSTTQNAASESAMHAAGGRLHFDSTRSSSVNFPPAAASPGAIAAAVGVAGGGWQPAPPIAGGSFGFVPDPLPQGAASFAGRLLAPMGQQQQQQWPGGGFAVAGGAAAPSGLTSGGGGLSSAGSLASTPATAGGLPGGGSQPLSAAASAAGWNYNPQQQPVPQPRGTLSAQQLHQQASPTVSLPMEFTDLPLVSLGSSGNRPMLGGIFDEDEQDIRTALAALAAGGSAAGAAEGSAVSRLPLWAQESCWRQNLPIAACGEARPPHLGPPAEVLQGGFFPQQPGIAMRMSQLDVQPPANLGTHFGGASEQRHPPPLQQQLHPPPAAGFLPPEDHDGSGPPMPPGFRSNTL